jgi:hypothetical protein
MPSGRGGGLGENGRVVRFKIACVATEVAVPIRIAGPKPTSTLVIHSVNVCSQPATAHVLDIAI